MKKPIKPTKPIAPRFAPIKSTVVEEFVPVREDATNEVVALPSNQVPNEWDDLPDDGEHFNDNYSLLESANLLALNKLCETNRWDMRNVEISSYIPDAYNETSYMLIKHNHYLDKAEIESLKNQQQERMDAYNKAKVAYEQALAEYKVDIARYRVWEAERKLEKVKLDAGE